MRDQASRLRQMVEGNAVSDPGHHMAANDDGKPYVVAVTSGKGGVGKTTIAVNLALLLAEQGNRVLLVDADLGLANVDVMLGMGTGRHIGHILLADYSADDVAAVGPNGIRVISGGSGMLELAGASRNDRNRLLTKLREYYSCFDYVLFDTSPGIGPEVVDFLAGADEVVLATTPEPTSLRDTYAALKAVCGEMPTTRVHLVVNAVTFDAQAERVVDTINEVSERFLGRRYDEWTLIEYDQLVGRTILDRRPLISAYPRSSAAISLRRLARQIEDHRMKLAHVEDSREVEHAVA